MTSGCAGVKTEDLQNSAGQSEADAPGTFSQGIYQNGFAVLSGNGIPSIYLDENHSYMPLCAKPDCSHGEGDITCSAILLEKESGGWFRYYDGSLWFIPFQFEDDSYLYQSDLWGNNLKKIGQVLPGISNTSPVFFRDGRMIRLVWNMTHDDNFQSTGVDTYITAIDLQTGAETILVGPVHFRNTCMTLKGAYEEAIYYTVNAGVLEGYPYQTLVSMNCKTGERVTMEDNLTDCQVYGLVLQWLFVKESGENEEILWQYDLQQGTKKAVTFPEEATPSASMDVFLMRDHLLIRNDGKEWWKYDPRTDAMEHLKSGNTAEGFVPQHQTETGYLGIITKPDVTPLALAQEYAFLSFEDFKNGEEPLVLSHNGRKPLNVE